MRAPPPSHSIRWQRRHKNKHTQKKKKKKRPPSLLSRLLLCHEQVKKCGKGREVQQQHQQLNYNCKILTKCQETIIRQAGASFIRCCCSAAVWCTIAKKLNDQKTAGTKARYFLLVLVLRYAYCCRCCYTAVCQLSQQPPPASTALHTILHGNM